MWVTLLIAGGILLRRNKWKILSFAGQVIAVALIATFIIVAVLAALGDNRISVGDATVVAGQMMASYYLPFFWFPLAIGLILGGFRTNKQEAEQVGDGDAEEAV